MTESKTLQGRPYQRTREVKNSKTGGKGFAFYTPEPASLEDAFFFKRRTPGDAGKGKMTTKREQ